MNYIVNILNAYNSFDLFIMLAVIVAKTTFLLAFAALLCYGFRRFSAATRHLLWVSVLCASLLLPFLSFIKGWEVSILPAQTVVSNNTFEIAETSVQPDTAGSFERSDLLPKAPEFQKNPDTFEKSLPLLNTSELPESAPKNIGSLWANLINGFLVLWCVGVALLLLRLLAGIISTTWLARHAAEVESPELLESFSSILQELNLKGNIRLLSSKHTLMPIVCGIWRPVVILPVAAESWTSERCRMVLLHELTHVARRDCLTQMLAQLACTFYWFNPFVWVAARRLRVEREQACDDYVVSIGTRPSDYAGHLLEIARSLQKEKRRSVFVWSQTTTVAMAQQSQLEERLRAILSTQKKHGAASRTIAIGLIMLISILFLSLVIIHPTTIHAQNSSSDSVEIISNSLPGATKEQRSLLDFILKPSSGMPDKIPNKPVENKDNNSVLVEAPEDQSANRASGVPSAKAESLQPEIEPTPVTPAPAPEKNVPEPDPVPTPDPAPDTFIKTEYEPDRNSRNQEETSDFIDEMASIGYKNLSVNELIQLKSVGVTADYVKSLRAVGFDTLTVRELINLRAVGVTPKFIESIRNAGYKDATQREISTMAAISVNTEYIEKIRNAGYDQLPLRNLIEFKNLNVTPDFINTMNGIGFGKLGAKDLVQLRVFNITPEFIRLARTRLGNDLTIKQLIGLKNSGVLKDQ